MDGGINRSERQERKTVGYFKYFSGIQIILFAFKTCTSTGGYLLHKWNSYSR